MELNSNEKIVSLFERTISLLSENNENQWANFLRNAKNNFIESDNKSQAVGPVVKSMLGGMGSLSDLVLHKDRKPLIDENNELYSLLNQLYDECSKL